MSIQETVEIECPECGGKQSATIWQALNATLNPEAKEALIKGDINVFHCRKCATEGMIPVELLYHDMRKRFCVQFYPFDWLDEDDFLMNFTPEGELKEFDDLPPELKLFFKYRGDHMKRIHIVFDMGELVRYIIFRDRLYEQGSSKV